MRAHEELISLEKADWKVASFRSNYLEIRRPAFEKDSPVVAAVIHQKFFAELTDEKRAETTNGAYPSVISYLQTKRTSVAQFYLTYLRTNAINLKRFRAMLDKQLEELVGDIISEDELSLRRWVFGVRDRLCEVEIVCPKQQPRNST